MLQGGMKKSPPVRGLVCLAALTAVMPLSGAQAAGPPTQTVLLLRHGEKPDAGLGQLTCQGLNRALALPAVIARQFGTPIAVVAPDPAVKKPDGAASYDYVRPLATIEPTAIRFGLPINADIGVDDLDRLENLLDTPAWQAGLVVVAWEHHAIEKLIRKLAGSAPAWPGTDFDSIYVLRITRDGAHRTVTVDHRQEGLNGQPSTCPNP